MTELSRSAAVLPFQQKPKPHARAHGAPTSDQSLPTLNAPLNARFLRYDALVAGRCVIIELYAPEGATKQQRIALWGRHAREGVDLRELGLCAQALERAGINWRQADGIEEILRSASDHTSSVID